MQKIKDYIYYNRKEIIIIIIFLLSFLSFNIFNSKQDSIVLTNNIEKESVENNTNINIIVDVKGEVINPGTYQFESGKRVVDAIEKSGGLTNKADVSSINLSEKLVDEMVIYIPTKSDDGNQSIIDNKEKKENKIDSKVSINTANISSLMTLSGIGKKKAEAIVEYREKNGAFKSIEDITKVTGIGNSIFEKIKNNIKL